MPHSNGEEMKNQWINQQCDLSRTSINRADNSVGDEDHHPNEIFVISFSHIKSNIEIWEMVR